MTKIRTYRCPGHGEHPPHQFSHLHHPSVEASPLPRYCPACGYDSEGEEMQTALTAPHIRRSIGRAVDDTYRAMEEGSQHRAEYAQEHLGLDEAEASVMKITDMKDNLRHGDTSEVTVKNPVSETMAAAPQGMFGFQGSAGLGYSGTVSEGPHPNAGARAQGALRQHHAAYTAGSGMAGAATSNMPALETTAPGYKKRV